MDFYFRTIDHKFVTGIYRNVESFNVEVICYFTQVAMFFRRLDVKPIYSQLPQA